VSKFFFKNRAIVIQEYKSKQIFEKKGKTLVKLVKGLRFKG
jgi:hypothetical protein